MKLSISEILKAAEKSGRKPDKVAYLQSQDNPTLRAILSYTYDPRQVCLLPEGVPPYTPDNSPESQGMLYSETRRLRIFYKGNGYDHLDPLKRENLFINMCEGLHADDALVIISMKDKKKFPGLSSAVIKSAFPDLFEEEDEEEETDGQDLS